jgi:hypothetical protein
MHCRKAHVVQQLTIAELLSSTCHEPAEVIIHLQQHHQSPQCRKPQTTSTLLVITLMKLSYPYSG